MNFFKSIFYLLIRLSNIFLSLLLLSMPFTVQAQQFDNAYLKWKADQQAQDAKLNKSNDQYYLSRPTVSSPLAKANTHSTVASGTKISINSAGLEQLQQLNGAGPKKAQAIIDYRNQNGQFKTIEDLGNVKGIGAKFIEKNRAVLSL